MSLRFRYKVFRVGRPVIALGGRSVRPRPVVAVSLIGPANTAVRETLLDTGADDTIFPEYLAAHLGIDLDLAPITNGSGIGMAAVPFRLAEITLRMADHYERREWRAWVGFTPAPMLLPVLGFAGCLQFFTATFHGDREEVELTINRLYPGT